MVWISVATLKKIKKIKNPSWANKKTKKTQGHISIHLAQISGKNPALPLKSQLFPKKLPFHPPKFLMTFFLVINSDFRLFTLFFRFSARNLLRISYFEPKNTKINVFFVYI